MTSSATIVVDLSFGDAGKGTTVEFLASQAESTAVVRYNGGPQAAHTVVLPDGRSHTFAQFGSASLRPGTVTHLSQDMLINPLTMYPEADHLIDMGVYDIWSRTSVDYRAQIITPWHRAANRLRETARGTHRHGSTGHGVGEAIMDSYLYPQHCLTTGDLYRDDLVERLDAARLTKRAQASAWPGLDLSGEDWHILNDVGLSRLIADRYREWASQVKIAHGDYLATLAVEYEQLVFEGAQGVLLDEMWGFHPHTTWSNVTAGNARRLLGEIGYQGPVKTLGVLRTATTRHGAGPLPGEDSALTAALPEPHNPTSDWAGSFRVGHFDALLHRYASHIVGGVDGLVLTHLDRLGNQWGTVTSYDASSVKEADRYFVGDVHGVSDIKLGAYGDLPHQAGLTDALRAVRPVVAQMSSAPETVIKAVEDALGVPVVITSSGPTLDDKLVRRG